jgi:hypothetical protein
MDEMIQTQLTHRMAGATVAVINCRKIYYITLAIGFPLSTRSKQLHDLITWCHPFFSDPPCWAKLIKHIIDNPQVITVFMDSINHSK